jgi:hypothetical protein
MTANQARAIIRNMSETGQHARVDEAVEQVTGKNNVVTNFGSVLIDFPKASQWASEKTLIKIATLLDAPEPKTEPKTKSTQKPQFSVGEWVTRDGKKVTVTDRTPADAELYYPLIDSEGHSYTLGGHHYDAKILSPRDLVGPWQEPKPQFGAGTWLTREGKKAIVTDTQQAGPKLTHPLINLDTGEYYTLDGKYHIGRGEHARDLVGPWIEPAPTFSVGEWVTREGKKVVVTGHAPADVGLTYPLMDNEGKTYTLDGQINKMKTPCPGDLVGPWSTPKTRPYYLVGDIVRRVFDKNIWGKRTLSVVEEVVMLEDHERIYTTGHRMNVSENIALVYRPTGPLKIGAGRWFNGLGNVVTLASAHGNRDGIIHWRDQNGNHYYANGKSTISDSLLDLLCPAKFVSSTPIPEPKPFTGEWTSDAGLVQINRILEQPHV